MRGLGRVAAAVGLAAALGCGGGGAPVAPTITGKDLMEDVKRMLAFAAEQKLKVPTKAAELDTVEPVAPLAGPAIRDGDIVYAWGAGLTGGGAVVAHEKKAETAGGWVLLQDGTVKEMTADEFKAAPRAKK